MLKSKKATKREEEQKNSWSVSGEFIYRRREECRLKFYDPNHETFPIPLKYVYVIGQTQTRIKQCLSEAKDVTLFLRSGLGTTIFQILRTRFPE